MQKISRIKKVVLMIITGVTLIGLIHIVSALTLDRKIEYKEVTFYHEKITTELSGYKIAFVADTHALPLTELALIVEEINKWQPDILVIGGDYCGYDEPQKVMAVFAGAETKQGIYGVEGNHDVGYDLFKAMEENGICSLHNRGLYLNEDFYLAGVSDLFFGRAEASKAVEDSVEENFVLLLSHNPDIVMTQDMSKVDLVLSGHTHAGQISFFGLWAPLFSISNTITGYGQRFRTGWANGDDGTAVYISNGVGSDAGIPRIFARPQVIYLQLFPNE